jgi:hypothetical protein
MAYGLEIVNDSGSVQIATGISNFYLVESGSVSVSAGTGSFTITPTVDYDIMAMNCDCWILAHPIFTSLKSANVALTTRKNSNAGTVNWWAFRSYKALTPSTSGYGLEIYNPDGTVGFSSNQPKILRAHSKIPITTSVSTSNSLPSGQVFAFISYGVVTKGGTITAGMGGGAEDIVLGPTFNYSSGNVTTNVNQRIGSGSVDDVYVGGLLAIDVTGY